MRNSNSKKAVALILITIMTMSAWLSFGSVLAKDKKAGTIVSAVKNNKEYDLTNKYIKDWLKHYNGGVYKLWGDTVERSYPNGVKLAWKPKGAKVKNYVVKIATDKDFTSPIKIVTKKKSAVVYNLMTGTRYYWQVYNRNKSAIKSKIYTFRTKAGFRTIKVDGVSNMRDIGGKKIPGGKIKQGMLYRSSRLDGITPEGKKVMLKDLKIKTDFDLRRKGEGLGGSGSPLGKKVKYMNLPATQYMRLWEDFWYGIISATERTPENNKATICKEMRVLKEEKNYPIDFHCMVGRDRTGTLAFLIQAMMGVKKKELFQDYELTMFSKEGYEYGDQIIGISAVQAMQGDIRMVYTRISHYPGSTFQKKTVAFLRDMGLSKKELNKIKYILLESNED